jgi:hypothetical protein
MTCIYTGARVYLPEYDRTIAADLHKVGDCVVVALPAGISDCYDWGRVVETHEVVLGDDSYCNRTQDTYIVPRSQVKGEFHE